MKSRNSHNALKARAASVLRGVEKCVTGSILLGGVSYTSTALKDVFRAQIESIEDVQAQHLALHEASAAAKAAGKNAKRVYLLLRGAILMQQGSNAPVVLNHFGMPAPRVPAPRSAEANAAAALKAAATRAARRAAEPTS